MNILRVKNIEPSHRKQLKISSNLGPIMIFTFDRIIEI